MEGQQQQAVPNTEQDTQNIEQQMRRGLQDKTSLTPLRISPKLGSPSLGKEIGVNLLSMFVPGVGGALQHHIRQQKETQINQVVNDFTTLSAVWDEHQSMSNGNQDQAKQRFISDPRVTAILGDKKKAKLLSKAFNIDLMQPEKTQNNVAFQGLQRFLNLKNAKGSIDKIQQMGQAISQQGGGAQQMQPGAQPQQPQAQPSQGERTAQRFADVMPKTVHQPQMIDVERAGQTIRSIVSAMTEAEPKTEFQAWYRQAKKEGEVTTAKLDAHHEAYKLKPVDMLIQQAIDKAQNGDAEGAKQDLELAHNAANAAHPTGHKNFIDLIYGANQGNKEDSHALDVYMNKQDEMRESYGKGRARYMYNSYQMKDGTIRPMSGLDIFNWIQDHPDEAPPIPSGRLTSAQEISIQQLLSEAGPKGSDSYESGALKGIYDNIAAFDNSKDRFIFANAMSGVEHTSDWLATMKNVLTQVEVDKLSPDGKKLYVNLQRLAETMGRFRASMGLPATDQSMSLSLALLPGKGTPSSDVAKMLLDNLSTMIDKAQVPALGGKPKADSGSGKGKMSLDDFLKGGAKTPEKKPLENIPKPVAPARTQGEHEPAEKVKIGGKEYYVTGENADGSPKLSEIHKE